MVAKELVTGFGVIKGISIFILCLASGEVNADGCNAKGPLRPPVERQVSCLLKEFDEDPSQFMNRILDKHVRTQTGEYRLPVEPLLTQGLNSKHDFVDIKDRTRSYAVGQSPQFFGDEGRAPIQPNDRPENLVDAHPQFEGLITSLTEVEAFELLSGESLIEPWSDYYWPIYRGQLGNRYADYSLAADWIELLQEFFEPLRSIFEIVSQNSQKRLKNLSPSEKYDLLIGDLSDWHPPSGRGYRNYWLNQTRWQTEIPPGYLTPGQWHTGQSYYNQSEDGQIETWMGLCHGWAAASYTMARPQKTVTVLGSDGVTELEFRPTDIKGLISQTWSEARFRSRFIGGRCNVKDPEMDENGRVIDQNCFDTNPGTWHLTVVNQVGRNQSSFVMDATYDYEVWNFPVISYQYVYFHPLTGEISSSWKDAAVDINSLEFVAKDRFRQYRFASEEEYSMFPHKRPNYVVGVGMQVEYVAGSGPSSLDEDSPLYDAVQSVTYIYDLELNQRGEVFGGEWYNNNHPDFLWHIPEDLVKAKPYFTAADRALLRAGSDSWEKNRGVPASWRTPAKTLSQSKRSLGLIVDQLIEWARD